MVNSRLSFARNFILAENNRSRSSPLLQAATRWRSVWRNSTENKILMKFILLFFLSLNINAQIQQEFYVEDAVNVELLTVNFCVDNIGKTSSVTIIPEKTTYKNQENINQVVEYRKSIEYFPDSKLRNNCYDYTFRFINRKYENKKLDSLKIPICKLFRSGTFKYNDGINLETTIDRNNETQIEKSKGETSKYKIEWTNDTNYILTYIEVSNKESEYLVGEKIYVEIIEILDEESYVYKSNLLDRTVVTGIIKKIN